jgi:hypothetical protein
MGPGLSGQLSVLQPGDRVHSEEKVVRRGASHKHLFREVSVPHGSHDQTMRQADCF